MTLAVHRSERADVLVDGLARLLADVPADPFTPEIVAVPSKGVERWIAQTLAASLGTVEGGDAGGGDGICANVRFPSPARVVSAALSAGTGVDPDDDPWTERRLAWVLLDVVDHCGTEEWCRTLGRHLGLLEGQLDQGRRVSVAQKLAGLYVAYAAQRPAMLRNWAAGLDTDGFGVGMDPDLVWQAELWRRVRAEIGAPSPAERLDDACRQLRAEPDLVDLPGRLSVFGPSRLTAEQLQVFDALAEAREVHLWLPHSSHALWQEVTAAPGGVVARRDDPTAAVPRHPLLRSCARDAREMQLRLRAQLRTVVDEALPVPATPATLLGRLQRDVREDRAPAVEPTVPGDRSVQVHACHGRQRQVEVLREVVVGMLQDDRTLEPRDVIVMCPDIETYAPLIGAAFGGLDGAGDAPQGTGDDRVAHPGHELRVRLADRSLRQTNPVLTVVARLLELADSRLTASEVLDLAAMPPVRHRFGLDDDALELAGDWVRRSGVRWGLDAAARAPYHLDSIRQNTWRAGVDRLLAGAAMDEEELRTIGLALPLDDVESNDVDLAGRLAELVDRVGEVVERLGREQTLAEWADALVEAVRELTDVAQHDEWQVTEARRQLADAVTAAGERATTVHMGLPDVRALLARRLRGRPTRAGFRTGHLTFCTMVPMRSVPHRVVCLLGIDDGVFPRQTQVDGDDVLGRTPRVGERDPRSEDRQLFLDAVLAAQERLVVLYTGADERTGAERPPAVPLGELLDVLGQMRPEPLAAEPSVVVRHPLQPFDARNFVAGELGDPNPFSFDGASYDGARSLLDPRPAATSFLARPLPDTSGELVELDDLVRFLEHPARGFLRQRLGLGSVEEGEQPDDAIPTEAKGLADWRLGDRLLRAGLAGTSKAQAVRAERLRGELPPGRLGDGVAGVIADQVEVLVNKTAPLRAGAAESLDVSVALSGGVLLSGTVPGVHDDRVVRVEYSRLSAKHRLRAWVHLLALAAGRPGREWCAATVGRGQDGPSMSALTAPTEQEARALLTTLVRVHRLGLCAPLPLTPKTSCCYAEQRATGSPPRAAEVKAAGQWRRSLRDRGEIGDFGDPENLRVWGDARLPDLLTEPARKGEEHDEEPHRFGQLARQVFGPLLEHEGLY